MVCTRLMNEKTPAETVIKEINNSNNICNNNNNNYNVDNNFLFDSNILISKGKNFSSTSYKNLKRKHF